MGPKPKKAPPPPPAKPPKFEINGFEVEQTKPDMITMVPIIPDNFDQVCFKLKITKNFRTGKPKYEVVYYECSPVEEESPAKAEGDERDMRVFALFDPETRKTLIVDPRKTQGAQPFLAFDPLTNQETLIQPHQMVHYDVETDRSYLLDIRQFKDGKLEFKAPETQTMMTVDLVKRVDPLTKKPVDHNILDVNLVGILNNGEMYVIQNEDTGDLYMKDNNGNTVDTESKGYHAEYDKENNTTSLLDDKDEPIFTLPGCVVLAGQKLMNDDTKFRVFEDHSGEKKFVDEEGEVVEPKPNTYWITENLLTGELELVDSTGEPVPYLPDFVVKKDLVKGKTVLFDKEGQPLEETKDMVINPSDSDTTINSKDQQQADGGPAAPDEVRLIKDPKTGLPVYKDSNNQLIPTRKMYQATDAITGNTKFFDASGKETKVNVNCSDDKDESKDKRSGSNLEKENPSSIISKELKEPTNTPEDVMNRQAKQPSLVPLKPQLVDVRKENTEEEEEEEEETYFQNLGYEEAKQIVAEIRKAPPESRSVFFQVLMEVIEMNLNLIKCALQEKLEAERKFVQNLMEYKEERQNIFIRELFQTRSGDYDSSRLYEKVHKKQDRENELLLDKLELRIRAENKVLVEMIKKCILKDSKKVSKYTNPLCSRHVKQILYKELETKVNEENKQMKREVCLAMLEERENTVNTINQIVSSSQSYS